MMLREIFTRTELLRLLNCHLLLSSEKKADEISNVRKHHPDGILSGKGHRQDVVDHPGETDRQTTAVSSENAAEQARKILDFFLW